MKSKLKLIILSMLVLTCIPGLISAQVITAPFDPTEPVVLPGASGWRQGQAFGVTYSESGGKRTFDGDEASKFDSSGASANAYFRFGNMSIDAVYGSKQTDVKLTTEAGPINKQFGLGRFNIAMSGNDFVSVGLGGTSITSTEYRDPTNVSVEITESAVGGSISIKTFDFLYVGGGIERVKKKSDIEVEATRNTMTMGAAVIFGTPGATQFRAEYSHSSSPAVEADADGELDENILRATTVARASGELMMNGLVFSGKMTQTVLKFDPAVDYGPVTGVEELTHTYTEGGVLWVPPEGLVLGFYFGTEKTEFFFEDEITEFKINIAYTF